MAIKMVSMRCPDCDAPLDIEEGRKQVYCSYCGAKIIINNENEHIIRIIDEAKIRQQEVEEQARQKNIEIEKAKLKQMEIEKKTQQEKLEFLERKRKAEEKHRKLKLKLTILMVILTLVFLALGIGTDNEVCGMIGLVSAIILMYMASGNKKEDSDDDIYLGDKVKIPKGISGYENKNYAVIESMFKSAGFSNVRSVPLNDLTTGLLKKPGKVESITVNGMAITTGGKKTSPDAAVIISYHSFAGR